MRAKIAVGLLVSAFVVISELKEPTRKILIFGDGLAGMVERVDAPTLSLSNVYTGAFLDTVRGAAPVPTEAPWYQVSFYLPNRAGGRFVGRTKFSRSFGGTADARIRRVAGCLYRFRWAGLLLQQFRTDDPQAVRGTIS